MCMYKTFLFLQKKNLAQKTIVRNLHLYHLSNSVEICDKRWLTISPGILKSYKWDRDYKLTFLLRRNICCVSIPYIDMNTCDFNHSTQPIV